MIDMSFILDGEDIFSFNDGNGQYLQKHENFLSKNYTPPGSPKYLTLQREVTMEDLKKQEMDMMPGFKVTWHYYGKEMNLDGQYRSPYSRPFVRNNKTT